MYTVLDEFCHLTNKTKIPLDEIGCNNYFDFLHQTVNICTDLCYEEPILQLRNAGVPFNYMSYFFGKYDEVRNFLIYALKQQSIF